MRKFDFPDFIEKIVISLRWLILIGLSASLVLQGTGSLPVMTILLGAAILNLWLTLRALFDRPVAAYRILILVADLLVANLLYFFVSILQGPLVWSGLLPIMSAALYFETRAMLTFTLITILSLGFQVFLLDPPILALASVGLASLLYLGVGVLMNFLRQRLRAAFEMSQGAQLIAQQKAERVEIDRRQAIYKLVTALSATLNYQRVLDTALDMCTTALASSSDQAGPLVSAVLLFSQTEAQETRLLVGSARRFTPADMRIELQGTRGVIGRAIDDGETRLAHNLAKDPELGRIVALRVCRAAYCVPLRTGLDTYGVMLFAHPDENFFTEEHREILDIIGNQAMIAIQNARLYHDLEQEKERMMEIQEEARRKLARDLHDGPTQSVAALAMRVNFARRMLERDGKAAVDELQKIEELARKTTNELRHMLFTLRPLVLESHGLTAALESMAEKMRETYNQNVIVISDQEIVAKLEMSKQAVVFYIAEEAVNNARKHAIAAHVWVRLKAVEGDMALLEIEDDGVGFDPGSVNSSYEHRGSLGMVNMRERAELVNGVLNIDSVEGRGTRVQLLIPLTNEAHERLRRRQ
ncbi:MAG TPA: GAF domain-containing sensor histidine kinase [Anaerolineales bacterium]|nr:GAF domain-containing sensor histidine kinase [Anaerolineales bacterium]